MYNSKGIAAFTLLSATLILVGCESAAVDTNQPARSEVSAQSEEANAVLEYFFAAGKTTRGYIWADGRLYGTIGTPATFRPGQVPSDELYNTGGNGTFQDGIPAISESKPGDQDYNGGHWHVNLLKDSVDPNKYANATSVDDLDLNDFVSTDIYFECPLLPRK